MPERRAILAGTGTGRAIRVRFRGKRGYMVIVGAEGFTILQSDWREAPIRLDGEYFWKFTDDPFDFDVILNTPLAFPVQFRKSRIDGGLVRVTLPERHGWQVYATLSHTRSLLFGPELGGLRFSATYAPVAAPDHDEPLAANVHVDVHGRGRFRPWSGVTWRYDSGLVAVE